MIYLALLLSILVFSLLLYFFEEFLFDKIKLWSVRWFFAGSIWLLIISLFFQYVEIIKTTIYDNQILIMLRFIENVFSFFIYAGSGVVLILFFAMFIHIVSIVGKQVVRQIKRIQKRL